MVNSQLWSNLEGLGFENVVIFYDHLEYFTAIWYNLWPFGIFCGYLVFFTFWYVWTKKNLATLNDRRLLLDIIYTCF
jgi:phosphotransferase system  glucose/maltose/N-acetylglucosamine-specific IIC component